MEVLARNQIMAFTDDDEDIVVCDAPGLPVSASLGHPVSSYLQLLHKVAALQYHNRRFRLLFRGQTKDYKLNKVGKDGTHSSLWPAILRSGPNQPSNEAYLDKRFDILRRAEGLLKDTLHVRDIHHNQVVRWAVLQHYEVCPTPLLDVTQSLQTALSFAVKNGTNTGFLYVFAFPQLTGPVSVSVESMTQVIDLCHLCPPEARRPHFQSGMLAADYPLFTTREDTHDRRGMIGNSFSCRLLTKFALHDCNNWASEGFFATSEKVLFPNSSDEWYTVTQDIASKLNVT